MTAGGRARTWTTAARWQVGSWAPPATWQSVCTITQFILQTHLHPTCMHSFPTSSPSRSKTTLYKKDNFLFMFVHFVSKTCTSWTLLTLRTRLLMPFLLTRQPHHPAAAQTQSHQTELLTDFWFDVLSTAALGQNAALGEETQHQGTLSKTSASFGRRFDRTTRSLLQMEHTQTHTHTRSVTNGRKTCRRVHSSCVHKQ